MPWLREHVLLSHLYSKDRRKGDGGGDRGDRGKRREKRTQGREVTGQREERCKGEESLR